METGLKLVIEQAEKGYSVKLYRLASNGDDHALLDNAVAPTMERALVLGVCFVANTDVLIPCDMA